MSKYADKTLEERTWERERYWALRRRKEELTARYRRTLGAHQVAKAITAGWLK